MANIEKSPPAAEPAAPEPKRSSPLALILPLVIVTVIAVGAGGAFGTFFIPQVQVLAESKAPSPADHGDRRLAGGASLKTLAPIITNLAGPKSTWIRLETALVLEGEPSADADLLGAKVADDILAFLRTISLSQIEGASGLQNLREDLNDLVRIRSSGKVRELVIETLVVE
jgi:flagellar FliL protein